jgi:uncharacterized protein with WD repeat
MKTRILYGPFASGGGGQVTTLDNSAQLAAQEAAQQQAQQQQQWLQEQTQSQQNAQNQAAQQAAQQAQTTAQNQATSQQQAQATQQAAQEKAAEAASAPYQTSQNSTALQPINTAASLIAGSQGATGSAGLPGFNTVMAKQKAAQGFLGQQNSLTSAGGVKLGGS